MTPQDYNIPKTHILIPVLIKGIREKGEITCIQTGHVAWLNGPVFIIAQVALASVHASSMSSTKN